MRAVIRSSNDGKVEAEQPFGSFYSFTELEDLPYVETDSKTFRQAAEGKAENVKAALLGAADVLESNGECWSRKVEREALYEGYGLPHLSIYLNLKFEEF